MKNEEYKKVNELRKKVSELQKDRNNFLKNIAKTRDRKLRKKFLKNLKPTIKEYMKENNRMIIDKKSLLLAE